jgi:RloB-like protein
VSRSSISRRRPNRVPRPRILVVCEGEVTELSYLRSFVNYERARLIDVEFYGEGGVPKTLVERAVDRKRAAEREARRQRDYFLKYEEVWCVFDVDGHPNLSAAIDQARANGIRLAISNPCFELWALLHFADQRAHIERQHVRLACRQHIPELAKLLPFQVLIERYEQAVDRVRALARWQEQQGRRGANPSTDVFLLTERIRELSAMAYIENLKRRPK